MIANTSLLIFTDESDPQQKAINDRVRTWGLKFVKLKPECIEHYKQEFTPDHPFLSGQPLRVYEVDWTWDRVQVWCVRPDEPWRPCRLWIGTKWLEVIGDLP